MDQDLKGRLEACGADVDATLKRFMGNEALYTRFLLKFPDDKNLAGLRETIPAGEYGDAFRYAHTLKGVAANLGIGSVYDAADRIVEELRNKDAADVDAERVGALLGELEESHAAVCRVIETI